MKPIKLIRLLLLGFILYSTMVLIGYLACAVLWLVAPLIIYLGIKSCKLIRAITNINAWHQMESYNKRETK